MVLLRFTKLTNKVRRRLKQWTARKPRKNPIKVGDLLQVYVIDYLGEATVLSLTPKPLGYFTDEDAKNDGFETKYDCQQTLMGMHKCDLSEKFDLINFAPHWEPTVVVPWAKIERLEELVNSLSDYFLPIGMLDIFEEFIEELKQL